MDIVIKKHLRSQEIHPAVHFLLQITDIVFLVLIFHMAFRIACGADAEIAGTADLLYKLKCIPEPFLRGEDHAGRNVAPEGKDVLDAQFLQVADHPAHLFFRRRCAGEMRKA